jgi:hypothetical protein
MKTKTLTQQPPQIRRRPHPLRPAVMKNRTCVYCGCTDRRACPGGCIWIIEHRFTPTGVCSQCHFSYLVFVAAEIHRAETPIRYRPTKKELRGLAPFWKLKNELRKS